MRARTEFWKYSSRNREGHKSHPVTQIRRQAVLIYWAAGWTEGAIATMMHIDLDTVGRHLSEARKAKDPRAVVRRPDLLGSRKTKRAALEEVAS